MTQPTAASSDTVRIAQLLIDLGSTADEVAATLREKGVTGVRHTVRILNPIVRCALVLVMGQPIGIDVQDGHTLRISYFDGSNRQEIVQLPAPVCEFLQAFNSGAYPDNEIRQ